MSDSGNDTLAELGTRLWVRLAADLVAQESGQPPDIGSSRKPQVTAALMSGMRQFYAIHRAQFDDIDIEIDKLLEAHIKRDPLTMKVVDMQKAAKAIRNHLYGEHELMLPAHVIYSTLREEIDAMRIERGLINQRGH